MCVFIAQSCLTLQPLDCSPPSSSVHGILQARKLEQVAISFSRNLCFLCLLHWQVNCLQSTVAETLRLSPNKCRHNSLQQAILPYFKGLKKMFGMIKHLVIPVHCLSVTLMRWVQLCGSLSILWHCLSSRLEWKLTFFSPVTIAEFSYFASILSAALL